MRIWDTEKIRLQSATNFGSKDLMMGLVSACSAPRDGCPQKIPVTVVLSSSYPSLCGHRLTGKMILNDDNPLELEYSTPCWGPNSCSIISLLLLPAIISICVYPINFRHKMVGFIPTSLGLFGVSQAQLLFFPRFLSPDVSRGVPSQTWPRSAASGVPNCVTDSPQICGTWFSGMAFTDCTATCGWDAEILG